MACYLSKSQFAGVRISPPKFTARYTHSVTQHISKKIKLLKLDDEKDIAKPLCVILGWGGSRHKNLERYGEVFNSRGYNTITVTPSLADILLFPETKGKKISKQVLETIKQEFSGRSSVFLQFSNAGCGLYQFIYQELYDANSPYHNQIKINGSIFDSCPIIPNKESIVLAQKAFTMNIKSAIVRNVLWYSIGFAVPFVVWLNSTINTFFESLRDSPISTPQLFMYSKSDILAPYKDISDFIEYRRSKGVETMKMLWEDTPHVSHFKQDPTTYLKVLNEFLDKLDI